MDAVLLRLQMLSEIHDILLKVMLTRCDSVDYLKLLTRVDVLVFRYVSRSR